jgi:hypothetical protein
MFNPPPSIKNKTKTQINQAHMSEGFTKVKNCPMTDFTK